MAQTTAPKQIHLRGEDGKKVATLTIKNKTDVSQTSPDVQAYQQAEPDITITSGDKILTITIAE